MQNRPHARVSAGKSDPSLLIGRESYVVFPCGPLRCTDNPAEKHAPSVSSPMIRMPPVREHRADAKQQKEKSQHLADAGSQENHKKHSLPDDPRSDLRKVICLLLRARCPPCYLLSKANPRANLLLGSGSKEKVCAIFFPNASMSSLLPE